MKKMKITGGDSAQDLLRPREHPLDVFFQPESVALIGATENPGSVGRTVISPVSPAASDRPARSWIETA